MASNAREALLQAAERLMAERGRDVPLRDVALAAGQRNNSAVQYHIGTRDELIDAVLRWRIQAMEERRLELLAEHESRSRGNDVLALVDILIRPMYDAVDEGGVPRYARFLEQVRSHLRLDDGLAMLDENLHATRMVVIRLDQALGDLPEDLRRDRMKFLWSAAFALLADRERALEAGLDTRHLEVDHLVSMMAAILTAPVPVTSS